MAEKNMPALVIDDGFRKVPVQNMDGEQIGVFYFNPTDLGIIDRYNELADSFGEILRPLAEAGDEADDETIQAAFKESEKLLIEACNRLFNGDFAEAFFGKTAPFSPVGGRFYCEAALEMVGKYISDQFEAETKKIEQRTQKYLKGLQGHKKRTRK